MPPVLREHKYYPFGPYLAEMPVDPVYCAKLLKLGKKLKKSHRKNLSGQIYHEYLYPLATEPWIFKEFHEYWGVLRLDFYGICMIMMNFGDLEAGI